MLQPIEEILTEDQKLWRAFGLGGGVANWAAICPETGAQLSASSGRRKAGRPSRWILILPNKTPTERGGLLESYEWDDGERRFITGYTLSEALPKAQVALNKMLQKRKQTV